MKEAPRKRSPFRRTSANFRVAVTDTSAEIMLYDEIGWMGVTAAQFKQELDAITVPNVTLRVNSPGGEIFDSLAIFNAIREHPSTVTARIDGLEASMASVIALAADHVEMADNAFYMIHNPWSLVVGNAADMRKEADILDKVTGSLLSIYGEKTGLGEAELQALLGAETWFTAAEAFEAGFVDAIDSGAEQDEAAAVAAAFDLSIFAHVPEPLSMSDEKRDPTTRELERALRDAGLSQIAAKQYIASGRAAASQRDADEAGERDAAPEPRRTTHHPYV